MIFLFAALVEFAVVNSLARRDISKANKLVPDDDEPKLKVSQTNTVIVIKINYSEYVLKLHLSQICNITDN